MKFALSRLYIRNCLDIYVYVYFEKKPFSFNEFLNKKLIFFKINLGGSVGDLRLLAGSTHSITSFSDSNRMTKRLNQAAAAVELELYSMVGRLQIEIKGFVVFLSSLLKCI